MKKKQRNTRNVLIVSILALIVVLSLVLIGLLMGGKDDTTVNSNTDEEKNSITANNGDLLVGNDTDPLVDNNDGATVEDNQLGDSSLEDDVNNSVADNGTQQEENNTSDGDNDINDSVGDNSDAVNIADNQLNQDNQDQDNQDQNDQVQDNPGQDNPGQDNPGQDNPVQDNLVQDANDDLDIAVGGLDGNAMIDNNPPNDANDDLDIAIGGLDGNAMIDNNPPNDANDDLDIAIGGLDGNAMIDNNASDEDPIPDENWIEIDGVDADSYWVEYDEDFVFDEYYMSYGFSEYIITLHNASFRDNITEDELESIVTYERSGRPASDLYFAENNDHQLYIIFTVADEDEKNVIGISELLVTLDNSLLEDSNNYETVEWVVEANDCGGGTANDPWRIENEDQFIMLNIFSDDYFILMNDLNYQDNLRSITSTFTGSLDGNNKTINCQSLNCSADSENFGLFCDLNGATIKDLVINDFYFHTTYQYSGILAGTATNSTITNVDVNESLLSGTSNVGGLIGRVDGETVISNCDLYDTEIEVTGNNCGSIAGIANNTLIRNCSVTDGYVYTNANCMGGIIGYVTSSINGGNVTIEGTDFEGECFGASELGGIVGNANGALVISNCNTNVLIFGDSGRVGGIIGRANNILNINNCTSSGYLSGNGYIGGIAGDLASGVSFGSIIDCSNEIDTFNFISTSDTLIRVHRIVGSGGDRVTLDNHSCLITITNIDRDDLSDQVEVFDQYGPDGIYP